GLAHLLAVAAAHAEIEQGATGARDLLAREQTLAEVGQRLRQANAGFMEDRTDAVAFAAVHAVERARRGRLERGCGEHRGRDSRWQLFGRRHSESRADRGWLATPARGAREKPHQAPQGASDAGPGGA